MNKFMDFMENKFSPIASKVEKNRFISSIKNGMVSLIAVLIIGSFTLIISSIGNLFPDGTVVKEFFVQNADILQLPFNFTFGLLSLYAALTISYAHARRLEAPILQSMMGAAITTLVLDCQFVDGNFQVGYLDSRGLFIAIFSALISVEVLNLFVKKNLTIRIKGLPEMVAATFESIAPLLTILVGSVALSVAVSIGSGGKAIPEVLTTFLAPAMNSIDTPMAVFVISLLEMLFWFIGLHGYAILVGFVMPFMTQYLAENMAAFQSGDPISHVFAPNFWDYFMGFTGSGLTGALVLLALFSKSTELKAIGKASVVPMIFTISEPIVFGLPICFNPYLFIPFVLGTPFIATTQWFIFHYGIVRPPVANVGGTPIFLANYLSTMDWKAPILAVLVLALGVLMYYPFFKMYETSEMKKSNAAAAEENAILSELNLDF